MQRIGDIARLNAKRYPEKMALIMGDDFLTYRQLNQQANQLAYGLLSMGIRPGDRVAILALNCIECVMVQYAVAKCGSVLVPLNFRYKKDELVYAINNSSPKVLILGPEFVSLVEEVKSEFLSQPHFVPISGECVKPGTRCQCRSSFALFDYLHQWNNRVSKRCPRLSHRFHEHLFRNGCGRGRPA
jgi:acyl-CoA synthetase (AMP-forming)/AMP-acid ligase II